MGRFLQKTGLRDKLFLTTKTCPHDLSGAQSTLEQSLERLGVDQVDAFFLHNLKDPEELSPELLAKVKAWQRAGKIKYFGFSTHAPRLVDVMNRAAEVGWVDAILFKYNFRDYGNAELNKAIDACKKADIGLIAMKTQGSAFSFIESVKPFEADGYTHGQAVLKAVWHDQRIDASVSAMKGFAQLEENVAAARDRKKLGATTLEVLREYALATDHAYCRGCEHHCTSAMGKEVAVADTLRLLMYHDEYKEPRKARRLFRQLSPRARDFSGVDLAKGQAACPHQLDLPRLIARARAVLDVPGEAFPV